MIDGGGRTEAEVMAMTPRQILARLTVKDRIRRANLAEFASVTATATHGDKKQINELIKKLTA